MDELSPLIVYARAGEVVTCEGGHEICTVAADIVLGDPKDYDSQFTDWRQLKKPPANVGVHRCRKWLCRAQWMAGSDCPGSLHFDRGWRFVHGETGELIHRKHLPGRG